jgi:regulatory protein
VNGTGRRRPRESFADRRAARAAIDDPEVVLAAGLRYLEARERSIGETRRRLTEAGYRAELVEGTVAHLIGIGLLDDSAFARHWVESRDRARPRGESALRRELRLRGVDGSVVDEVLEARRGEPSALRSSGSSDERSEGAPVDPDELAARHLLDRRRRDLDRVTDPRRRRARAYALLARNGFGPEIAARLAASVVDRSPDPAEDELVE